MEPKESAEWEAGVREEGESTPCKAPGAGPGRAAQLLGLGFPQVWLSSCPPVPRLGLWDLHGYEAGHGGLETVKDEASGEGHEVVHEGRQGEDE